MMKFALYLILLFSFFASANEQVDIVIKQQTHNENARYEVGFVDLNNDQIQDAVVYLNDRNWCGSGGCTTFILKGVKSGFEFQSKVMIVKKPIVISQSKSNGYMDIIVNTGGVGSVVLKFNGKTYPLNPSTQPPVKNPKSMTGQVLLN